MKRPTNKRGSFVTTPRAAELQGSLGGSVVKGVALTRGEVANIRRIYGIKQEEPDFIFAEDGSNRNAMRRAEVDGLRLLAWIAKYTEEGEDPLGTLVELAHNAGWDVDPADVNWSYYPTE